MSTQFSSSTMRSPSVERSVVSPVPEKCFKAKHLAKPLSFGPVFKASLCDGSQESPCSRAAVSAQDLLQARLKWPALDYVALT